MVLKLADDAISTAAHISSHNKHPGIDGVESRDTVAGVNTTSLNECDGHRCRSRSRYRSAQRGQPWALQRLLLLTKTIPVGSHKKLGPPLCHDDNSKAIAAEEAAGAIAVIRGWGRVHIAPQRNTPRY